MRRRTFYRAFAAVMLVVLGIIMVLTGLILREPASYRQASVAEGPQRRRLSGELQSAIFQMMPGNQPDSEWHETFTAEQINSYFAEDFLRAKPFQLPDGIHSPRVELGANRLVLSFKYGKGLWSTVVSIDMNAWLVAGEANTLAIEFLETRAGLLPLSVRTLIEKYLRSSREWNVDVTWYRHQGHPVALVRVHAEQSRVPFLLQRLELQPGRLVVAGRMSEDTKVSSILP